MAAAPLPGFIIKMVTSFLHEVLTSGRIVLAGNMKEKITTFVLMNKSQ